MEQMKTFNGYEIVDSKARQEIIDLKGTGGFDLSNYYTKAETTAVINDTLSRLEVPEDYVTTAELEQMGYAKVSDIPDVSDFITAIPDDYATKKYVDEKAGAVTAEWSVVADDVYKNYATKVYVDNLVQTEIEKEKGWRWVECHGQFLWLTEDEAHKSQNSKHIRLVVSCDNGNPAVFDISSPTNSRLLDYNTPIRLPNLAGIGSGNTFTITFTKDIDCPVYHDATGTKIDGYRINHLGYYFWQEE